MTTITPTNSRCGCVRSCAHRYEHSNAYSYAQSKTQRYAPSNAHSCTQSKTQRYTHRYAFTNALRRKLLFGLLTLTFITQSAYAMTHHPERSSYAQDTRNEHTYTGTQTVSESVRQSAYVEHTGTHRRRVPNSVANSVPNSAPGSVANSVPNSVPGNVPNSVSNSNAEDFPQRAIDTNSERHGELHTHRKLTPVSRSKLYRILAQLDPLQPVSLKQIYYIVKTNALYRTQTGGGDSGFGSYSNTESNTIGRVGAPSSGHSERSREALQAGGVSPDTGRMVSPDTDNARRVNPDTSQDTGTARRLSTDTDAARRVSPDTGTARRVSPDTNTARRLSSDTDTGRRVSPDTDAARRDSPDTDTSRRVSPDTGRLEGAQGHPLARVLYHARHKIDASTTHTTSHTASHSDSQPASQPDIHEPDSHPHPPQRPQVSDSVYISAETRLGLQELMRRLQRLEHDTETSPDPSEPPFFEDDIVLTADQALIILAEVDGQSGQETAQKKRKKRKLDAPLTKRWGLPIAYTFDGNHNEQEKRRIYEALAYWQEQTCIDFVENPRAQYKLYFVRGKGCWSYVGFTNNENQTLSIGENCQSNGTIAHEIGHAIGFWHEHTRPDRDSFVYINKLNVTAGKLYNFDRRSWGDIVTLDIPYDLGSDMHYGSKFYSKSSNLSTMETLDPLMRRVIGQRQELSFYDVKLANQAYCSAVCDNLTLVEGCRRDGYQDPRDCSKCRCPDGFGGQFCQQLDKPQNARCGGEWMLAYNYNATILSPNYREDYGINVKCNYLVRAPEGNRIHLRFMDQIGVAGHEDVCRDYVEVRYNSSLALTGARFCMDKLPKEEIVSDSNEMLILFRSFEESRLCDDEDNPWKCRLVYTGFMAYVWMESCGGCGSERAEVQGACVRREEYPCEQVWQEERQLQCPPWWFNGCGYTTITRSRSATCFRDQLYCCDGYELDGSICKAEYMRTNRINTAPTNTNRQDDQSDRIPVLPASQPGRPVTEWGSWGPCSEPCGRGVRRRTRQCLWPMCGESDVDERSCNTQPCYQKCAVTRPALCDLWTSCTKTTYEDCKPYCASGSVLYEGRCVKEGLRPPASTSP